MKKILSAIGGFFVKIGRWIANTAWIQPLLIVGGIFAVIFSIPYIKQGFENLAKKDEVDEKIQYYKDRAIDLTGAENNESKLDALLTYLEKGSNEDLAKVKSEYGEKFFISFATENCSYCKECYDGFKSLDEHFSEWNLDGQFKFYSVMVDTKNDDDKYLAKYVFEAHQDFFDEIVGEFAETVDEYALMANLDSSKKSTLIESINKLQSAIDDNGEGLETPTTLFIDLTAKGTSQEVNVNGVTAIFFNYVDLLSSDGYTETTAYNKGKFLSDCWTYSRVFDKEWDKTK